MIRPVAGKPGVYFVEEYGVDVEASDLERAYMAGGMRESDVLDEILRRARTRSVSRQPGAGLAPSLVRLRGAIEGVVFEGDKAAKAVEDAASKIRVAADATEESKPKELSKGRTRAVAVVDELLNEEKKGDR